MANITDMLQNAANTSANRGEADNSSPQARSEASEKQTQRQGKRRRGVGPEANTNVSTQGYGL